MPSLLDLLLEYGSIDQVNVVRHIIGEHHSLSWPAHMTACRLLSRVCESWESNSFLSDLLTGWNIGWDDGLIFIKKDKTGKLSPDSTVMFYNDSDLEWDYERGEPLAIGQSTLNMEELYYYLELSYYLLIQKQFETKESFAWYLDELAKFRKTCEIKDIYGERLKDFREEYGVTIEV